MKDIDMIADEEQIKMMNEEYKKLGILDKENLMDDKIGSKPQEKGKETIGIDNDQNICRQKALSKSKIIKVPYPIYMQSDCIRYCELCELAGGIINNLDKNFVEKNKDILRYIYTIEDKNSIYVKALANLKGDIRVDIRPMPFIEAMKNLVGIMTNQIMLLDKILSYDKSENSKEIRLNQLGATACMQSLFLVGI